MKTTKEISASKFKATCVALLDEVQTSGQEIVVTKYGKPVAKVAPLDENDTERWKSLQGTVTYHDEIVKPLEKKCAVIYNDSVTGKKIHIETRLM